MFLLSVSVATATIVEIATPAANDILNVEDQQKEGPLGDLGFGRPLSIIPLFPLCSNSIDNISDHTMCLS